MDRLFFLGAAGLLLAVPGAPGVHRPALALAGLALALVGLGFFWLRERRVARSRLPSAPTLRRALGVGAWAAGQGLTAVACWGVLPAGTVRLVAFLAGSWAAVALGARIARRLAAPVAPARAEPEPAERLAA